MICKICGELSKEFDKAKILGKYDVSYYHCSSCGFVQTEEPYWLSESYSKAISKSDTGIMMRNLTNSANLLLFLKFIPKGNCLDFGGGHGILTRIMRDYGFDFFHYDKYAENLFASGFEGDINGNYKLLTSFENFEHFENPLEEIEKLINISETLYFTTLLLPSSPPNIINWWYYAPSGGQHISFYSIKTLEYIGKKFNLFLLSNNIDTHILSKNKINTSFFKYLSLYNRLNNITFSRFLKKRSKTWDDMNTILSIF
jgi:hypothetical protein